MMAKAPHKRLTMKKFITLSVLAALPILLTACQTIPHNASPTGLYVSDGYLEEQEQGYDWVAVNVDEQSNQSIKINVYSRSDVKKRPTCTFKGIAKPIAPHLYGVDDDNGQIIFSFDKKTLSIHGEGDANLYYYCSGGASLTGSYQKIKKGDE